VESSAARSAFRRRGLGVLAAEEAIRRSGVARERIDAVIGANVYQFTAPGAQDIYFPATWAALWPADRNAGLLVQRICGSGLQTVINALQQIAMPDEVDDAHVVLCVGAETMSRAPQIIRAPRKSAANFWEFAEDGAVEDSMLAGLRHDLAETAMMLTADEYGAKMGITRQQCDEFADCRTPAPAPPINKATSTVGTPRRHLALDAVDRGDDPYTCP